MNSTDGCRRRGLVSGFALLGVLTLTAGCATTERVESVESRVGSSEQRNEVQDQRLSDIERGTARAMEEQAQRLDALLERQEELELAVEKVAQEREAIRVRLQAEEGSTAVLTERSETGETERRSILETLERSQGDLLALRRRHEEQVRATRQYRTEQLAELDAVLQHLTGLQALLQSPIGDLPSKTEADKLFRQAHALIIHGELDLAADRFGEFVGKYPDDERVVEATYRQGQVYFLARRYDHALVPSFAVVDGHPEHPRAVDARWVLARSLEEKGDFVLARQFYAEMIDGNTKYQADAMRRVQFLNELQPLAENGGG